ncbi:MAG: carbohydrate-binding domain-containing protein [Oscillospiraceae bacterium]|nr:carbohydrate-binding domain-containing protein [Oscillospiraceae bacterium]
MKKLRLLSIIISLLLLFSACGKIGSENGEPGNTGNFGDSSNAEPVEVDFSKTDSDMFTDRDLRADYDEKTSVLIELNGDSVSCNSNAVQISGTTATITGDGTYILSGTLDDGMIIIDAGNKGKPQLVLNGVTVNSKTSAPIYVLNADKVFLTLAPNTENTLTNGGMFTAIDENNIDAVIFSKDDLTLNGSGSLTVNSPAGHGIVSKDDLVFTGGTYTVNSASHGLDANDSVRITNTTLTVDAGKDGIHSENSDDESLGFVYISSGTFDISAEGDGISAKAYMQIENGSFNIVSGGGSVNASKQTSDSWGGFMGGNRGPSFNSSSDSDDSGTSIKGIKSNGDMLISNGKFIIDSADDSVHSNASIVVNGGIFEIASGDDGFHADEALTVTAGTINITESYEGLEALNLTITGGNIKLIAADDGLNAAGGTDFSGFGGFRGNDHFGGPGGAPGGRGPGGQGGPGGGMGESSSSNGTIVISGGTIYIKASGDGIDANGILEISGGHITVCGPTQGDTATLDYDISGVITGGTFIGTGASGMAQTFSDSEQGVVAVNVGNQSSGTKIVLKDKSGNTIISYEPELPFAVVILSTPELIKGETYEITVGTLSGEFEAS